MDAERPTVLVVEDDDATAAFLADNLARRRLQAVAARGAEEGLRAIEVRRPDLVVLDLMLGDGSGLELLDRVRAADGLASRIDPELPVIVLTGRAGGVRPRARLRARRRRLRRQAVPLPGAAGAHPRRAAARARPAAARACMRVGELTLDPVTRAVRLAGEPVELSAKEFALLHALAEEPTRVFGKHELLRDVWGYLSLAPRGRSTPTRAGCARSSRLLAAVGRERARRRLPAHGGAVSALGAARGPRLDLALAIARVLRLPQALELVARAEHELRGAAAALVLAPSGCGAIGRTRAAARSRSTAARAAARRARRSRRRRARRRAEPRGGR